MLDDFGHARQEYRQFLADERESLFDLQGFGVVLDIHRGGAQMDDSPAGLALGCVHLDLSHQVMMQLLFDLQRPGNIDLTGVVFQILHLLRGDQSPFHLGFSHHHPQLAPQQPLIFLAPHPAHFG